MPAAPGPLQSRYLRTHARPHCQRAHTHTLRSRNIADFFVHKFPLSSGLQKIITSAPGGGVRGGAGAGGCERPERLPCISAHGHAQYRARSMKIVPYATLSQQGQCQRRRGSESVSQRRAEIIRSSALISCAAGCGRARSGKKGRFGLDVACPQTERSATAKMQRVAKAAGGRGSGDGSCDGTHRWTRRGE